MEYSSTKIAEILGIEKNLLRSWEKRTNIVNPARDVHGSRIFSESDFQILKKMKNLTVERKFKIEEAERQIIEDELQEQLAIERKLKIEEVKETLKSLLELVRK